VERSTEEWKLTKEEGGEVVAKTWWGLLRQLPDCIDANASKRLAVSKRTGRWG